MQKTAVAICLACLTPASPSSAAERYYIPCVGWSKFNDGVTYEQALQIADAKGGCDQQAQAAAPDDIKAGYSTDEARTSPPYSPESQTSSSADIILAVLAMAAFAAVTWAGHSFSCRGIDRRKAKMAAKGYASNKWTHESLIWLFPSLVFWRRAALGWGWGKVVAFLIWVAGSSLFSAFVMASAFPALDGFGFYAARLLLYGLLAVFFCIIESGFPDQSLPRPSAPIESWPVSRPPPSSGQQAAPRNGDSDPYAIAGEEVLSGNVEPGLWARALVEGSGADGPVRAAYVSARVAQLGASSVRSKTGAQKNQPRSSAKVEAKPTVQDAQPKDEISQRTVAQDPAAEMAAMLINRARYGAASNMPVQTSDDCVAVLTASGASVQVQPDGWIVRLPEGESFLVDSAAALKRLAINMRESGSRR